MSEERNIILQWAETGSIRSDNVQRALKVSSARPGKSEWLQFLNRLLLWLALTALASGVIFFFAFNWDELGRFTKFGLMQVLIIASTLAYITLDPCKGISSAALMGLSLLIGALLALTGQTYQTGADVWELFAVWFVMITPLAFIGRSSSLWLLWLALVNLSLFLYLNTFRGFLNFLFSEEEWLWFFLLFNSFLLIVFEFIYASEKFDIIKEWMPKRIFVQVCTIISGFVVSCLAIESIFDWNDVGGWGFLVYTVWMMGVYYYYRYRLPDLLILSGIILSLIVVGNCLLFELLHDVLNDGIFLLISISIIVMSAGGGILLKRLSGGFSGK